MTNKRGRKRKYSDEERAILNKCKEKTVYNSTKAILQLDSNDINITLNQLENQIKQAYSIQDMDERNDQIRIIRSVIKNAKRIQSLRMLEQVDVRQDMKDNYHEVMDRMDELSKKNRIKDISDDEQQELNELGKRVDNWQEIFGNDFSFEEERITHEEELRERYGDGSPDGLTDDDIEYGYNFSDFDNDSVYIEQDELAEPGTLQLDEFFASGGSEYQEKSRKDVYQGWYGGYISGQSYD